jgi:nicotinate-nucleotide adenylyltransferase
MPGGRRLALVEAACTGDPVLAASDLELHRDGPTFTAETLEQVAADYPGADLWFILGADQLAGFASWSRPERILELARLGVAMRPGSDGRAAGEVARGIAEGRLDLIEMPEVPVSSTVVRERLARGESIRDIVPVPVADLLEPATSS